MACPDEGRLNQALSGKKGVIFGIANRDSIAYGCARAMREQGAELAVTFLNAKAEPHVRPLAQELGAEIVLACDVERQGELEAVFDTVRQRWGRVDFAVHAIAYAPKACLTERIVDCEREAFFRAIDISCHSFVRMARLAQPLMTQGGSLLTMSYYGAEKVIENYKVMGPIKAALESFVRYLAAELGSAGIRVHALSPGPMKTRAASGLEDFDVLLELAAQRSPLRRLGTPADAGAVCAFLASDAAAAMTGNIVHVDAGYHVLG